jgi:hypothetical protein
VTISGDNPGAGAGRLETVAAVDTYTFAVPDGPSNRVAIDWTRTPGNNSAVAYKIVNVATGAVVLNVPYSGSDTYTAPLPGGTYRLEIRACNSDSAYIGDYSLKLALDTGPQNFTIPLPATISADNPGAGAGRLETVAAVDTYTFAIPDGPSNRVAIDWTRTPSNNSAVTYKVVNVATGAVVLDVPYSGSDTYTAPLPAGTYRLEIWACNSDALYIGDYALNLALDTGPQNFTISLPATISADNPGAGAGRLENLAAVDTYTFAIPEGPARKLNLNFTKAPQGAGLISYKLVNTATNAVVLNKASGSTAVTDALPAGTYRLEVSVFYKDGSYTGTYALNLSLT